MKVFISQPTSGKTHEQTEEEREIAIETIKELYSNESIEIFDSIFENAPYDAKPLWFLGKSLMVLSNADLAFFTRGWSNDCDCNMQYQVCMNYHIPTLTSAH